MWGAPTTKTLHQRVFEGKIEATELYIFLEHVNHSVSPLSLVERRTGSLP